jgi:hypothetical protein
MWNQGSADWASQNPILPIGTQVYDNVLDKFKVGDGLTNYNSLPYIAGPNVVAAIGTTTGTISLNMSIVYAYTVTLSGALTINAINNPTGSKGSSVYLVVTSAGNNNAITFGTNFKSIGTLNEGSSSGKIFVMEFLNIDGTTWAETSRTTAM